ncbi:hypothetical protein K438DRAFT_1985910 [Mycena galopus ATCC 62051]|nr:hypothetical protein K438DRAFT_1985910 [Mycena galopus ATCC 62051]
MPDSPRGSPPTSTPTNAAEAAIVKDYPQRTDALKTRPEVVEAVNERSLNKVTDLATARRHLEMHNFVSAGGRFTRSELFTILMKMSLLPQAGMGKLANTLRALVYMGEEIDMTVIEEVAQAVGDAVGPVLDTVVKSQTTLNTGLGGLEEEVKNLRGMLAEIKEEVRVVGTEARATAAAAVAAPAPTAPRSYVAAAGAPPAMTAEHAAVLA